MRCSRSSLPLWSFVHHKPGRAEFRLIWFITSHSFHTNRVKTFDVKVLLMAGLHRYVVACAHLANGTDHRTVTMAPPLLLTSEV